MKDYLLSAGVKKLDFAAASIDCDAVNCCNKTQEMNGSDVRAGCGNAAPVLVWTLSQSTMVSFPPWRQASVLAGTRPELVDRQIEL